MTWHFARNAHQTEFNQTEIDKVLISGKKQTDNKSKALKQIIS